MIYAQIDKQTQHIVGKNESHLDLSMYDNESTVYLPLGELDFDTVKCVSFTDTETIVVQPERQIPIFDAETGEQIGVEIVPPVTEEREFTNYRLELDETLVPAKQARIKQELISEAYARMDKDVFDACEATYGTRRADSATAFYLTFQGMLANPAAYVGAMFADEAAVLAYATPRMAAAEQYAVYRLGRIAQYEAEKAAILAQ